MKHFKLESSEVPVASHDIIEEIEDNEDVISDLEFKKHFSQNFLKKFDLSKEQNAKNFITFNDNSGENFLIRKSSLIWKMNLEKKRVSSDRVYRFISDKNLSTKSQSDDVLKIGNYAAFIENNEITYGMVLGFQYKTGKNKKYSLSFCPLEPPKDSEARGIGVMLSHLSLTDENCLIASNIMKYIDINSFLIHIEVSLNNDKTVISSNSVDEIQELLCDFIN